MKWASRARQRAGSFSLIADESWKPLVLMISSSHPQPTVPSNSCNAMRVIPMAGRRRPCDSYSEVSSRMSTSAIFHLMSTARSPSHPTVTLWKSTGWCSLPDNWPPIQTTTTALARRYPGADPQGDGQPAPGPAGHRPQPSPMSSVVPHFSDAFRSRLRGHERNLCIILFSDGCRREPPLVSRILRAAASSKSI